MCTCAEELNTKLKEHNYKLTRNLLEENAPMLIEIHKIEKRKRTPSMSMVASYCPCCGKKYPARRSKGVLKDAR